MPEDQQLSPMERMYLRSMLTEHYVKTQGQQTNSPSSFKRVLNKDIKEHNKSNGWRDFGRGGLGGGIVGGITGAATGAIAGSGIKGRLLNAGAFGAIAGGIGGVIGGTENTIRGHMMRSLGSKPKKVLDDETKEIFDRDSGGYDKARAVNRASNVSSIAGLASAPLQMALGGAVAPYYGSLEDLDDENLVKMMKHLDLDKGDKKMMFGKIHSNGKVTPGFPENETSPMLQENAFFSPGGKDEFGKELQGTVAASSKRMTRPGIMAHELGHANIHKSKGLTGFMQNHLYEHIHPRSAVGQYYGVLPTALTGLATKDDDSVTEGALKGGAIGAAAYSPILLPEFEASRRGIKAMMHTNMSRGAKVRNAAGLLPAFATYALSTIGPSAAVGGYNGYLNKKRKQEKAHPPTLATGLSK